MTDIVPIRRALISLSDKAGLDALAAGLAKAGVELVSTGGTAAKLRELGHDVRDISDLTGFPEMMDGRVKTLHPKVHGGLLAVRNNAEHLLAMEEHGIGAIDLVVVNLYPFEATVARGAARDDIIENIDIGGPSMVRSAAKNHEFVAVVTDPVDYGELLEQLADNGGTDLALRRKLAAKAYARTAAYDSMIASWFAFADQGQAHPESRF
ncbi:MAG: bifunctional phosphoribosylaminoimidazolecarboxamide formyltransferase/IMP cyclohydrolase, partial [Sphingomicrobium sp.]